MPLARYDRLKDKGKLTQPETGLDTYVPGFDPKTFKDPEGFAALLPFGLGS